LKSSFGELNQGLWKGCGEEEGLSVRWKLREDLVKLSCKSEFEESTRAFGINYEKYKRKKSLPIRFVKDNKLNCAKLQVHLDSEME